MGAPHSLPCCSVEKGEEQNPYAVRRHVNYPNGPMQNPPEYPTMQQICIEYLTKYSSRPYLGVRPLKDGKYEPKYVFTTYRENKIRAEQLGSGLHHLGIGNKKTLGVYMENNPSWVNAIDASCLYGFVIVSLYDSLGPDSLQYLTKHSKMEAILVSTNNYPKIMSILSENSYNVHHIIVNDSKIPAGTEKYKVSIHSINDVLQMGEKFVEYPEIDPEQPHFVCYSSGTTGNPKGVLISHRATVSNTLGAEKILELGNNGRHLSYLPLAHVFERAAVSATCRAGGCIGFNMGSTANLMSDMSVLRPTYLAAVPRVLNRVYDGVQAKLKQSSFVKRALFGAMWSLKRFCINHDLPTGLMDSLAFSQIKAMTGGCVEQFVVGAAALDPRVQEFLMVATGAMVRVGYGLTEAGSGNVCVPKDIHSCKLGAVGGPLPNVEVRLEPIDGYDVPGCGQILIGGPCLSSGYLYDEEATAALFVDAERRWIRTGDIGKYDSDGYLYVVDRMRSIFKLSQGEYVAADPLTQIYDAVDIVRQTFIYGDSSRSCLVAVVVPSAPDLARFLGKEKLSSDEVKAACRDPSVAAEVLRRMNEAATNARLFGYQKVRAVHLEPDAWTVENEMLTPTFKLKRKKLEVVYKDVIDELYKSL